MAEYTVDPKVRKYETFLNDKLKIDLKVTHDARDKIYQQIAEYIQLKQVISAIKLDKDYTFKKPLRTKVDLGCNFYCQASVEDCSRIYVLVGYGYYLEMTLGEAETFIEKKIATLQGKCQMFLRDSAKIKAHIRLVMEALREIQNLKFADQNQKNCVF